MYDVAVMQENKDVYEISGSSPGFSGSSPGCAGIKVIETND